MQLLDFHPSRSLPNGSFLMPVIKRIISLPVEADQAEPVPEGIGEHRQLAEGSGRGRTLLHRPGCGHPVDRRL
ncbi:hypothetical protein, partial [Paracoccus niistensis]|uniref:hypothetical protein n=1 Tax=Paracoccus niistensis TaxID=632935 RepID=UPI00406BCCA0